MTRGHRRLLFDVRHYYNENQEMTIHLSRGAIAVPMGSVIVVHPFRKAKTPRGRSPRRGASRGAPALVLPLGSRTRWAPGLAVPCRIGVPSSCSGWVPTGQVGLGQSSGLPGGGQTPCLIVDRRLPRKRARGSLILIEDFRRSGVPRQDRLPAVASACRLSMTQRSEPQSVLAALARVHDARRIAITPTASADS